MTPALAVVFVAGFLAGVAATYLYEDFLDWLDRKWGDR